MTRLLRRRVSFQEVLECGQHVLQRCAVLAVHHDLHSKAVAYFGDGRFDNRSNDHFCAGFVHQPAVNALACLAEFHGIDVIHPQQYDMPKRWEVCALPASQFVAGHGRIITANDGLQDGVVWFPGLNEYFSWALASSGASGDLCEQLKRPFAASEIGKAERLVSRKDADEGDHGKIVSFGHHLGADEHIELSSTEVIENGFHGFGAVGISVEAADAHILERFGKGAFEAFGSGAHAF